MRAADLMAEARARGVSLYRRGDRLRWRAAAPIAPELAERLREHREALLALVPEGPSAAESLPTSTKPVKCEEMKIALIHAPDAIPSVAGTAYDWLGLRIASRILGEDVWVAADDASAETLERELETEGDSTLVFTLAEVMAMEGMLAADIQAIAKLKRTLTGADVGGRIESVTRRERSA